MGSSSDLKRAAGEQAELVLGTRMAGEDGRDHLTASQRFGNRLAVTLIRLFWGVRHADLGPLRLISRRAFERLKLRDRGFGWTVEMQVRAAEEGLKIIELPVRNFPRRGGDSKISGTIKGSIQAGARILFTMGALWWRRNWPQSK
jgi:hypothetical protein